MSEYRRYLTETRSLDSPSSKGAVLSIPSAKSVRRRTQAAAATAQTFRLVKPHDTWWLERIEMPMAF